MYLLTELSKKLLYLDTRMVLLQMFPLKTTVGIDIGSNIVRAALIQKRGKSLRLYALISEPIQEEGLEDALLKLKKKIKRAHKLPRFWFTHFVMGVAQSNVAIKRFSSTPDPHEQEQYLQVGLQLAESLGLPIDELLYDYRALADADGVEVYACRRAVINDALAALTGAGYRLSVIELQTHALLRLYQQQRTKSSAVECSLMVDVGSERVQICADDGKSGQFFHELPLTFNSKVASTEEAVRAFTEQLIDIIQRQYQFVATSLKGAYVNRIWLSGENLKYLDMFLLKEKLQWQVQTLNPLQGLIYPQELIENLPDLASAWSIAVGLALRDAG